MAEAAPVRDEEFAAAMAAMAPFEGRPTLAVAVSGGADSTALALLARRWATARGGEILALIVDHALRPESSAEAHLTRDRLAARGIPAETLTRTGARPQGRVQEIARRDRYALLDETCRRRAILHLLLGHHVADQRETVAMRMARPGGGTDGSAGMAAIVEADGLRRLRPLLGFSPERLRATLRAMGQPWLDDPSNADRRFERVRRRLGGDGPDPERVAQAAGARRAREARRAMLVARLVRPQPQGFVEVTPLADLLALEGEAAVDLLRRCLWTVSGAAYPPAVAAVAALLAALGSPGFVGRTLAGCEVRARRGGVTILREPRAAGAVEPVAGRAGVLWDGRFRVDATGLPPGAAIGALGAAGVERYRRAARPRDEPWPEVPAKVSATFPAARTGDEIVAVGIPGQDSRGQARFRCAWTPRQSLAGAIF